LFTIGANAKASPIGILRRRFFLLFAKIQLVSAALCLYQTQLTVIEMPYVKTRNQTHHLFLEHIAKKQTNKQTNRLKNKREQLVDSKKKIPSIYKK